MPDQPAHHRIKCTATTQKDKPCRAWAMFGTDPPRCVAHGGGSGKHGAPKGNKNAVKHGLYADKWSPSPSLTLPAPKPLPIDQNQHGSWSAAPNEIEQTEMAHRIDLEQTITNVIQDLYDKHFALSDYIDRHAEEISLPEYSHLLALHAQMASRLGRLLRDLVAVSPDTFDWLDEVMRQAYVEISDNLGVNLTADPDYVPKTEQQT